MRIIIDTNVVIDALTAREPWNKAAETIFIMAANNIFDMYITASSATDIYYIVRKHIHGTSGTREIMEKLYDIVGILEVTQEQCIDALASSIKDYEDAVVEQVAVDNSIDYIVTRNIKDYKEGVIPVLLPDEFIHKIKENRYE